MNSSYYRSAKERVVTALRGNQCTFEELCKMCQGIYPTLVKEIIDELRIYNTLVPSYTTNQDLLPYEVLDENYYETRENITSSIQNNPVLSSWYFSWNTCSKIGQLDVWKNKNILFLGAPRLFEFFASRHYGESLTLIDLDSTVIDALSTRYQKNSDNLYLYSEDLSNSSLHDCKSLVIGSYDYVFFDPPWYLDDYLAWLEIALKYVCSGGSIVFSLFPALLRPTAVEERKLILDKCREVAKKAYLCSGHLEYDIPTFEKNELEIEGIKLRSNWKTSDMVVVSGILETKLSYVVKHDSGYAVWKEFWWLETRWFLDSSRSFAMDKQLLTAPLETKYLKTPSKRNIQLKEVNLLSSKGHGLRVSDPAQFLKIINQLQSIEKSSDFYSAISNLNIDCASKKLLQTLVEEI